MDYYNYYQNDVPNEGDRPYYSSRLKSQYQRHRNNNQRGKESRKEHNLDDQYEGLPTEYYDIYQQPLLYKNKQKSEDSNEVTSHRQYRHNIKDINMLKRKMNKKKRHQDFPITPEDERDFVYNEDAQDNNEIYTYDNNRTGEPLINASEEEEVEEKEQDNATKINTMLNSESIVIDSKTETPETISIKKQGNLSTLNPKKQKWYKNMGHIFINKVKILQKKSDKQKDIPAQHYQPSIQVITATNNNLLGDVLDSDQQKEIITQLTCSSPMPTTFNMCPEKTKITNLSRIWVFRLVSEEKLQEKDSIAWIGFDYENQVKIENHVKELSHIPEDGRLALYDSHIRHGKMPVIVTPNYSKGYYFADEEQSILITLEVTFIENNHQKVTFVYRV